MTNKIDDENVVNGTSGKTLQKIWTGLALTTFAVCYIGISRVQGEIVSITVPASVKIEFSTGRPDSVVAMICIIVLSALFVLSNAVLREYASRGGDTWPERYPFRLFDASPAIGVGRYVQWFAFAVFSIIPAITLVHMWRVFTSEGVICRETNGKWTPIWEGADGLLRWTKWLHIPEDATFIRIFSDYYRLAGESAVSDGCARAVTFFPVFEPIFMGCVTLAGFGFLVRGLWAVTRGARRPAQSPAAPD